jgi:hypothetical protein
MARVIIRPKAPAFECGLFFVIQYLLTHAGILRIGNEE